MGDIDALVSQYGLIALFLGCFLEGESIAIAGGVLAHRHLLVPWETVLVIAAGGFCSDTAWFLLGRRFRTHPRVLSLVRRQAVARVIAAVGRAPRRVAATFRFLPGARIVTPVVLAHSEIAPATYFSLTALAALVWATVYVMVGRGVGGALVLAFGGPQHTHHILIATALGVLAAALFAWWHLHRRRGED